MDETKKPTTGTPCFRRKTNRRHCGNRTDSLLRRSIIPQRSITDSLSPDLFGLIVSNHDTRNEVSSTFSRYFGETILGKAV
ncbi:hypothetical protein WN51_06912 [Melipona quadrifasciata]|uniref:Uncharacterized protein n=1 Tax=Melipona quadrifasciata TaxID=166423 RepID=A0A0M8ZQF5_9HYME|nr:hypothetical protein WN51_06912 [Melipona quadrifasciata]